MYPITKFGGGFVILGLAGLWTANAQAQDCGTYTYWTPARFTNGNVGDVALVGNSGSAAAQALAPIAGALGMTYFHSTMLSDTAGGVTETYWDGIAPPSSSQTGEPHECSRVVSPWYLARLGPGAWTGWDDVVQADLVQGLATTACSLTQYASSEYGTYDTYHINSFLNDDVPGGSCEKLLVDDCGIPVQYNTTPGGDRTVYDGGQYFAAMSAVWQEAYNSCAGVINNSWPWGGVGCGGTSETVACERAAWQFVNEIAYKAQPLQSESGWDDGWSDFNSGDPSVWSGTMLGAGKMNEETMPDGSLCPGACNDGSCNNPPIGCSAYEPDAWVANVPDNILHAAQRLNPDNTPGVPGYVVAGNVAPGYDTTINYGTCPDGQSCTPYAPNGYPTVGNCQTTCMNGVNCFSPYQCNYNACEYESS